MTGLIHPLDMTLVHRRELSPIQPFMLSAKQGGIGSHFLTVFGLTGPGLNPGLPCARRTLYHKATAPVQALEGLSYSENNGRTLPVSH